MTHEIPTEDLTGNGSQSSHTTYKIPDEGVVTGNGSQSSHTAYKIPDEGITENKLRPSSKSSSVRRIGMTLLGLMLLAGLGFFGFHALNKPKANSSSGKGKDRGAQVTPVTVGKVTQQTVPVQLQAIGHVTAGSTVSVTPQVGGQITGIYFKKGQEVKKGQLLFTLDDRTELATIQQAQGTLAKDMAQVQQARATLNKDLTSVRQAQANLAKDQAQAKFAQSQAGRYQSLYKQGAVTLDQSQQYATGGQTAAATVQADREAIANAQAAVKVDQATIQNAQGVVNSDQGVLQNAQVQLSYTKIYAPMDGRVGDYLVTQGNVVQANSTNPLVTIDQIRPIQVSFAVPENKLPDIQKYAKNNKLTVDVTFPSGHIQGVLSFVNNTVDNTTGTIQLLGIFDNALGQLWPGQYVNTTLTLTNQPNATVVPAQAVQNGPKGQFVFVLKPYDSEKGQTVEMVPVTVSNTLGGLDVVTNGLQPGQTVVTDGQANLTPGSKICIKSASASDPAACPSVNSGGNPNSGKRRSPRATGDNS